MSLLKRIYRIVRSQWESSGAGDWQEPPRRGESSTASSAQWEPAAQDPKLAEYFANLEVPYGANWPVIKKAWKRLLRKYHPDLHSNDAEKQKVATELVQGLNRAYEALKKHYHAE